MTMTRRRSSTSFLQTFGLKKKSAHIFGRRIVFFDYNFFVYLFEEIFMQQIYFFESPTARPFIVDCGSNIGMSIFYFKWLFPDCQIEAFEPDAKTFELLKLNTESATFSGVKLHNAAVMNYEGTVDFFNDGDHDGSLAMGVHRSRGAESSARVTCVTLSPILRRPVDFLKVDIEGAEAKVFQEIDLAGELSNVNQMVIECHHNIHPEPVLSIVLKILEKNKFKFQISSALRSPYPQNVSQDVMIYAYRSVPRV